MKAVALLLLLSVCLVSPASLDLTELDTVQYRVEIREAPVEEAQPGAASVTMVNKAGQKYRCSLPEMPEPSSEEQDGQEAAVPDISQLLAPLEAGPCMYKTKDWWTYEVCYKRSVKQYHVENDKPVGAIMVLGLHDPGQDVWEQTNTTFLPQFYTNGTQCDLTSRPRQAQLRFVCNEAAVQEFIGDIFEPQSCEYSIVIHTSRLCSVPWLRPVADPTPLPIVCQPLLSPAQLEQYNIYLQRKKVAEQLEAKKKEEERSSGLTAPLAGTAGEEAKSLESLLGSMSDNMADNLVQEIHSLLDKAMGGEAGAGLRVIDLRDKEKKEKSEDEDEDEKEEEKEKPVKTESLESKAPEGWDLVHHKHNPSSDPELRELVAQRNDLWRKIHEAKKQVKKYTSQLHDTDTFLKNERTEAVTNPDVVERLEFQKKTIEKALSKAHGAVAELEMKAKDVSHQLVAAQSRLMRSEERDWSVRLSQLRAAIRAGQVETEETLHNIARDYRKVTKERLTNIDDYMKVARKIVADTFPEEDLAEISEYLKKIEGLLPLENEILDEVSELSQENLETAAKFKDVVKDDIRTQFKDILREVSEELDIPNGDVDEDEAMAEMSKTLDKLMTKIAGTGKAIDKAQKTVDHMKKAVLEEEADTEDLSLKRDNKMSVKKDLSQKALSDDDYNDEEDEEPEGGMEELEAASELLDQAEAELSALEKDMKDVITANGKAEDSDNVKVSVTNMSPGGATDEKTEEIVKKLEDSIKNKLGKLGVDTGGRPIEIKLITTQIPEGLQGEEGEEAQVRLANFPSTVFDVFILLQMQGLLFNMMTGNLQGYDDINNQRLLENNYKFNWNPELMQDLEKKIADLSEDEPDQSDVEDVDNRESVVVEEKLVSMIPEDLDIYEGGDERTRPSSLHSKTGDGDSITEHNDDESADGTNRDEL